MSFFVGNVSPVVLTLLHKSHYLIILFFFYFTGYVAPALMTALMLLSAVVPRNFDANFLRLL
jgi:hypothetical protein